MKLTLGFLFAFGVAAVFAAIPKEIRLSSHARQWKQWKMIHSKEYETNVEEVSRFNIWMDNLKKVQEHNAAYDLGLKSFNLEMNKFADLTSQEFAARLGTKRALIKPHDNHVKLSDPGPDSQDWVAKGYVTPVKNQKQCGSCWAFSTVGGVEGQHFNATGNLISLSEQQLVDCVTGCNGCNGGSVSTAYNYLKWVGSRSEADYPYTFEKGTCVQHQYPIVANISTYEYVYPYRDEIVLKNAVGNIGPVSTGIDANHDSFQLYKSGVYYEPSCSSSRLDHAVLLVGYGYDSSSGMDYWIVKNSWTDKWGQDGYAWMARNKDNHCGIATMATYPVIR